MRDKYGIVGGTSGQLITYRGAALVHDNRAEMEFLFPNARVVRLSKGLLGQPWMKLKDHPQMVSVRFPLRREDFP
jgi:hypothetical protein